MGTRTNARSKEKADSSAFAPQNDGRNTKSKTPHVSTTCGAPRQGLTFGERELHPLLREINFGFGFDYEHDGGGGIFAGVEALPGVFH